MILFLSPHADDVAISCSGLLHDLLAQDYIVGVATVFSGSPNSEQYTPLIHAACYPYSPDKWMHIRCEEDINAMSSLNIPFFQLDLPEAIFRCNDQGQLLHTDWNTLYQPYQYKEEVLIAEQLMAKLLLLIDENQVKFIIVPLAEGGHVDHQICRVCVQKIVEDMPDRLNVIFYEDYPFYPAANENLYSRFLYPTTFANKLSLLAHYPISSSTGNSNIKKVLHDIENNGAHPDYDYIERYYVRGLCQSSFDLLSQLSRDE